LDLSYRRYPPKPDRTTVALGVLALALVGVVVYRIVS
jgi:hypothetical protein